MSVLKVRGLSYSFVIIAVFLMFFSCSNTETGTPTDGDAQDDDTFGQECSSQNDCSLGQSCLNIGGSYVCTKQCTGDLDCRTAFPGGCCQQVGTGSFCMPLYECSGDGDEPITDGDLPIGCTPDTYRCEDARTIEYCNSAKQWVTYKNCSDDSCCSQGECIVMAGGGTNCETGAGETCIPDAYRCRGPKEVQRCASDGSLWDFYRDCQEDEICVDGVCNPVSFPVDGDTVPDGDQIPDGDEPVDECIDCTMLEGCEDPDTYCFSREPGAEEGCCRVLCDLPHGNCPRGTKCVHGTCQMVDGYCISDADCSMDEFCDKLPGYPDGLCNSYCFTMGHSCSVHTKCDENPSSLNYGKCVYDEECTACNYDDQCTMDLGVGYYCNLPLGLTDGCCMEMCGSANPCPGVMTCCADGRCGTNCGTECSRDCPPGYKCDPLYDECAFDCPPCPPNDCCTSDHPGVCMPDCICQNPIICGILLRPCCLGYRCSAIVYGVLGYCI